MIEDDITEGMKLIERGMSKFRSGPLDYYLKKLVKARELLLARFAPFKVGDRVTLSKDLDIQPDSGWYPCRHFLRPGFVGTVKHSDCDTEGRLRFEVEFDDESWIDYRGTVHPVESKHVFVLLEDQLSKE